MGQGPDHLCGGVLAGQCGLLSLGRFQGPGGDAVRVADTSIDQPGRQASQAASAEGGRGLVAGQQHQRALAGRVVEGPLQGGEHAGEHVAEPVDRSHPVGDQVGAVGGQEREVGGQLCGHVEGSEVPAMT